MATQTTTHKNTAQQIHQLGNILMLSAWGFAIVFASLLFLYLGHLLDEWLGTAPNFMFGLFFLAIVTSIGRLYQEAWLRRKEV
jgi:F0F1-type ATP synthase assembly protein I